MRDRLHARKVITCGEGGLLTTRDDATAEHLRSLRTHGADRPAEARQEEGLAPPSPRYGRLGYNYRLSDIQAAVASVQLRRLDDFVRERNDLAARTPSRLRESPRGQGRTPSTSSRTSACTWVSPPRSRSPSTRRRPRWPCPSSTASRTPIRIP